MLKEAWHGRLGATSWMAPRQPAHPRLASPLLREQGFSTLRQRTIWTWRAGSGCQAGADGLPPTPSSAPEQGAPSLLWHLEQAACPAQLRHLLDRRCEDLLDQTRALACSGCDPTRHSSGWRFAVSAGMVRPRTSLEVTLPSALVHLLGSALARTAGQCSRGPSGCGLRSDTNDSDRGRCLQDLGAVAEGERIVDGRSVCAQEHLERTAASPGGSTPCFEPFQAPPQASPDARWFANHGTSP